MRISRLLSAVCAVGFCASFVSLRADDNPAQAAARAALMEQLGESNGQPPQISTNAPAEVPAPVTPTNAPVQTNMPPAPTTEVPPPVTPTNMPVLVPSLTPTPPPQMSTNAPVAEPEPVATMPATVAPVTNETEQTMATNETAPSQMNAPTNMPAQTNMPPVEVPPPVTPPAMITTNTPPPQKFPGKNLGLEPIVAPPLPISPEKQAQLQELLERYKADQITPAQYQDARAKILADP